MKRQLKNYPPERSGRQPGQVSEYAFANTRDQQYLAAKRAGPQGDVYASVYVAVGQFGMHKETFNHALVLLDVVETKPMETRMVTVDAPAMAKGLATVGHVALYGIYFDTDKTDIKPESAATIKEIASLLKQDPKLGLYVVGHTDNVGGDDYNLDLSRRRAAAVVAALTSQHSIDPKRLKASGVGLSRSPRMRRKKPCEEPPRGTGEAVARFEARIEAMNNVEDRRYGLPRRRQLLPCARNRLT